MWRYLDVYDRDFTHFDRKRLINHFFLEFFANFPCSSSFLSTQFSLIPARASLPADQSPELLPD
jgi:hypothetical protein